MEVFRFYFPAKLKIISAKNHSLGSSVVSEATKLQKWSAEMAAVVAKGQGEGQASG